MERRGSRGNKLLSFWDLVNQDMGEYPGIILNLEATTQMTTSTPKVSTDHSESTSKAIVEVNLTAKDND